MTIPHILYIAIGSGIIALVAIVVALIMTKKVNDFTRGKNGASLEDTIREVIGIRDSIVNTHNEIKSILQNHNIRIAHKTSTPPALRFNPFETGGTNQSFAIAFLDEQGDGVVISSLYTREKTSIFAKPIKAFTSDFELTDEEQNVINQTRTK